MASLTDVNNAVAALETESAKENALLAQIHTDLVGALQNQADPAVLQTIVDRLGAVVTGQQAAETANPAPGA